LLRIPRAFHWDLRRGAFDLLKIVDRQLDRNRPDVLFQPMQLCGAWNGNDPRLLSQQPRKRDLGRGRLLLFRDAAKEIDKGLVRLPCFRCEARDDAADVGFVERRARVDLSCEEALAQRAVGNKSYP
jgi:hypothetical protein